MNNESKLDENLFGFSDNPKDQITLRQALNHLIVFGQTGSGKSSSSTRQIFTSFLKSNMGGLIMTAKSSDTRDYVNYIHALKEKGIIDRTNDVIVFSEGAEYSFSPLEYEQKRTGKGAGSIYNLVELLYSIYELDKSISGQGKSGRGDSDFWTKAVKRVIKYSLTLIYIAEKSITFSNLHGMVISLLNKDEYLRLQSILENRKTMIKDLRKWANSNFFIEVFYEATLKLSEKIDSGDRSKEREYHLARQFFDHFPKISEKTRSIVIESLLGILEPMLSGAAYEHFGVKPTNIEPELCFDGKIIILDWSIKEYGPLARLLQGIFKWQWMKAMERRSFQPEKDRAVFLMADEAHLFVNESYDHIFLSTSRSVGCAVCSITQNINSFYAALGGTNSVSRVKNLIGNYGVRIYHSNSDIETNNFAANSIGKVWKRILGHGVSAASGSSTSLNPQYVYQCEPVEFTQLAMGGPSNQFYSEVIATVAGKTFSNGKNFIKSPIKQILI